MDYIKEALAIIKGGADLKKGAVKQLHSEEIESRYSQGGKKPLGHLAKPDLDFKDDSAVAAEAEARAGGGSHDIHGNQRVPVSKASKLDVLFSLIKAGGGGNFPVPEEEDVIPQKPRQHGGGGGNLPMPSELDQEGKLGVVDALKPPYYGKPMEGGDDGSGAPKPDAGKKAPLEAGKPPRPGYKLQEVIVNLPGGKQFKSHRWVKENQPDKVEHKPDVKGAAKAAAGQVVIDNPPPGGWKPEDKVPDKYRKAGFAEPPAAEKEKAKAELKEKPIQHLWGDKPAEKPAEKLPPKFEGYPEPVAKPAAAAVAEKPAEVDVKQRTPKPAEGKAHLVDLDDKELSQRLDWYEHRYYSAKDAGDEQRKQDALWRLIAAQKEAKKRGFAWKPMAKRGPGETGGLGAGEYQHGGAAEQEKPWGEQPKPAAKPAPAVKPAPAPVAEKPGGDAKLAELQDHELIKRFKFYEDDYYKFKAAGDKEQMQKMVWKIVAVKKEMGKRGIQFQKAYDEELWQPNRYDDDLLKSIDDVEKEIILQEILLKACTEGEPIKEPFDIKKPSVTALKKALPVLAAAAPALAGGGGAAAGAGTAAAGAGTAAAGSGTAAAGMGGMKGAALQGAMSSMGGGGQGGDLKASKDVIIKSPASAALMPAVKTAAAAPKQPSMSQQFKSGLAQGAGQAVGSSIASSGNNGQSLQASHDTSVPGVLLKKAAALGLIKAEDAEEGDEDVKAKLLATVMRSYGTYLASANEAKEANRQLDAAATLQGLYTEGT